MHSLNTELNTDKIGYCSVSLAVLLCVYRFSCKSEWNFRRFMYSCVGRGYMEFSANVDGTVYVVTPKSFCIHYTRMRDLRHASSVIKRILLFTLFCNF